MKTALNEVGNAPTSNGKVLCGFFKNAILDEPENGTKECQCNDQNEYDSLFAKAIKLKSSLPTHIRRMINIIVQSKEDGDSEDSVEFQFNRNHLILKLN